MARIRVRRRDLAAGGGAGTWPLAPGASSVSGLTFSASRVNNICDPDSRRSKVLSNPLQGSQQLRALFGPEALQCQLIESTQNLHERPLQLAARGREKHLHRAPVFGTPLAPDQSLGLQAVQKTGDRPAIRADVAGEGRSENAVALPQPVQDLELGRRDVSFCRPGLELAPQRLADPADPEDKARVAHPSTCKQ